MIDCILTYPTPTKDSPVKGPALSIFYLGAMLEREGLNVEYFDERFDNFEELISLIKKTPLCVGVSAMTGHQLIGATKILKTVKKINPKIYTILGGVHPSLLPGQCIQDPLVDFVGVGEGEKTLLDLISTLKNGGDLNEVDGIVWKQNHKVVKNKGRAFMDPSELPFPMTIKNKKYFEISANAGELMYQTSRGCPYNCSFCYNHIFNRRTWRKMPLEKVEKELLKFKEELNFSHIHINDDNIGPNKKRVEKIAEIVKKLNCTWETEIRCDHIDKYLANILDESGCTELLLGVESGSDRVLKDIINKDYTTVEIRKCAQILGETSIRGRYNFICGVPGESKKELHKSMDFADELYNLDKDAIICFDAYAPYPGTKMYQQALKSGFKEPQNMQEWSKMSLSNPINPIAENMYYITGLRFRGKKDDVTSRNFPGFKRLTILPFEMLAHIRWRFKFIGYYGFEKFIVKRLFYWASKNAN